MREVQIGKLYKHFKGTEYRVIGLGMNEATEEDVVIYKKDGSDKYFVRTVESFLSEVDNEKYPDITQKYRFALASKIQLNPDQSFVNYMREKIKGKNGYCPCSIVMDDDHKCMCKEFRDMDEGTCHCGLYTKIPKE